MQGLDGGRASVSTTAIDYCEFTHPLHPAVLERILAAAKEAAS